MTIIKYDKATGAIISRHSSSAVMVIHNTETEDLIADDGSCPEANTVRDGVPVFVDRETEALKLIKIRMHRNSLLLMSDWTQIPTARVTEAQREEWNDYRDKLFNFPSECDINNPIWPQPPQ